MCHPASRLAGNRSFEKKSRHEALADIYESIDELKHYRAHWLGAATSR